MLKFLLLLFMAFLLSGCFISGPLSALSPTAMSLFSSSNSNNKEDTTPPISVDAMLQKARSFSAEETSQPFKAIQISYDELPIDKGQFKDLAENTGQIFDLTCGPYNHGNPIDAASLAIRACLNIQRTLLLYGIKLSTTFSPKAKEGHATLRRVSVKVDFNA